MRAARSVGLVVGLFAAMAVASGARAEEAPAKPNRSSSLEPIHEAQRHFAAGVTLYQDGDLRGALAEFKGAYKADPVYRVLYNLGLVSRELNDWAAALGYYRKYLAEGEERVPADRRLQIEREVLELAQRVGRLEIEVQDGPAEVQIDEQVLEPAQLEGPILVNPGRRKVRVTYGKKPAQIRTVDVASGDSLDLSFEPPATKAHEATARAAAPKPEAVEKRGDEDPPHWPVHARSRESEGQSSLSTYTWVATGVLLAAAATTGYFAYQASHDLSDYKNNNYPANGAVLASDRSRVQMLSTTADGLLAGGLLCALVSSYLTWHF